MQIHEERHFEPTNSFCADANVTREAYASMVDEGLRDPEAFWEKQARKLLWQAPWHQVLEWNAPRAKWFLGGKLNISQNCLDRHLTTPRATKRAIVWEGEDGQVRELSYADLHARVCEIAAVMTKCGINAGDRVAIYMPLIPEAVVAMLACARVGAIHSVIFGGFSAQSIRDRVRDAECAMVITADGGLRKGAVVALKAAVDEALADDACPSVKTVLVCERTKEPIEMKPGRDLWWHEQVALVTDSERGLPPEAFDAEHPLFILYTSGTTGKPKGVMHSTGGYLTQVAATTSWVFDLKDDDIYWCTADVGWITGHSYVVYGPLAQGATVFLYEGAPTYPQPDRFWSMIERHRITILYTAPTAIRLFMRLGTQHVAKHDLSSLRLLGSVGEPINPEAWMWYRENIGGNRCPIVDTWWQTETGAIMIAPLPGAVTTVPGSATRPLPGIAMEVAEGGYLIATRPWPSMARGIWGDDERFANTYFSQMPGSYFTGDGAHMDAEGNYWILGRIDDVVNVSGHRIGTMEVESALVAHLSVAEAAVVARPDALSGQAIVAFVTLKDNIEVDATIERQLMQNVAKEIGAFARPAQIRFTKALPKTRSGKIMRRLLRELATQGHITGDVTTLEDFGAISALQVGVE